MQCPRCKAIASDGAKFCLRCGAQLPTKLTAQVVSVTPSPSAPRANPHVVRPSGLNATAPQQEQVPQAAQMPPLAQQAPSPQNAQQVHARPLRPNVQQQVAPRQAFPQIASPQAWPTPTPPQQQIPNPAAKGQPIVGAADLTTLPHHQQRQPVAKQRSQVTPNTVQPGAVLPASALPTRRAQITNVPPTLTARRPVTARSRVDQHRPFSSVFVAFAAMLAITAPLAVAVSSTEGITGDYFAKDKSVVSEAEPSPTTSPAPGQNGFYTSHAAPFSAADLSPDWNASPGRFWYSRLTTRQQGIYDVFYAALASGSLECHIDIDSYDSDFDAASLALYLDNPEIFWYKEHFQYVYWDEPNRGMDIKFDSYYDISFVPDYQSSMESRINEFLATVPPGASSYEKAQLAFVWVSNQSIYEHCEHDQIITSVLLEGKSVCAGYARTYQVLLERMGIPCATLHGYNDSDPAEGHLWNIVCIDGVTGYVDVTWGDMNNGTVDSQYFFFDDTKLSQIGHHIDAENQSKVPACPLARNGRQ